MDTNGTHLFLESEPSLFGHLAMFVHTDKEFDSYLYIFIYKYEEKMKAINIQRVTESLKL